jgi:hypothetical protein
MLVISYAQFLILFLEFCSSPLSLFFFLVLISSVVGPLLCSAMPTVYLYTPIIGPLVRKILDDQFFNLSSPFYNSSSSFLQYLVISLPSSLFSFLKLLVSFFAQFLSLIFPIFGPSFPNSFSSFLSLLIFSFLSSLSLFHQYLVISFTILYPLFSNS